MSEVKLTAWEYRTEDYFGRHFYHQSSKTWLDTLGADGWELCGVRDNVFYFKRPVTEARVAETAGRLALEKEGGK